MNDLTRVKRMLDELCCQASRTGALTTDQAKDMLVLSESISALLTAFLFRQKVIYGGES